MTLPQWSLYLKYLDSRGKDNKIKGGIKSQLDINRGVVSWTEWT